MAHNRTIDNTISILEWVTDILKTRIRDIENDRATGAPKSPEQVDINNTLDDIEDIIKDLEKLDDKIEFSVEWDE